MKIVLTGVTGFIGSEVLRHCLKLPSVTSVIALCRKKLSDESVTKDPKLEVVLVEDFLSYPESVQKKIASADACIWALGIANPPNMEAGRKINLDYTIAGAETFIQSRDPKAAPLRFVYLSGFIAERDQQKPLWFLQEGRRLRGEVENRLLRLGEDNAGRFDAYVARPAFVLRPNFLIASAVLSLVPAIRTDFLAAALLSIALDQSSNEKKIWENRDLASKGADG